MGPACLWTRNLAFWVRQVRQGPFSKAEKTPASHGVRRLKMVAAFERRSTIEIVNDFLNQVPVDLDAMALALG